MNTTLSLGDTADDPAVAHAWALTLVFHPDRPDAHQRALLSAGATALGRASDVFGADALDGAGVSREHARLELNSLDELSITDCDSRNGTFVNGKRTTVARVYAGDVISVGDVMLLVERVRADANERGHTSSERLDAAIASLASTHSIALLCGETGTGKDRAARAIHTARARDGKFVAVHCGALPDANVAVELFGRQPGELGSDDPGRPGLLESADGGTVYLDSIDDASDVLQMSLLGFLDHGEIRRVGSANAAPADANVIASTRDWARMESLRPEFRQRVERVVVRVPPLRECRAEVLSLAAAFVRQFAGTDRALHRKLRLALLRHDFPGNVRQLAAFIEALVVEQGSDGPLRLTEEAQDRLRTGNPLTSQEVRASKVSSRLVIAADAQWCELDGATTDLSRRRPLRLVVAALAERRRSTPGAALSLDDLLAAGWPDETVLAEAGRNRVHVALTTLRKLGLRDVIIREDDGYLLDPAIDIDIQ